MRFRYFSMLALLVFHMPTSGAEPQDQTIEAATASGDRIFLHPNGRWEYIDKAKKAEADEITKQYPENRGCPSGNQGGFLGFGRCIQPGDKDFNRGSMSGKGR